VTGPDNQRWAGNLPPDTSDLIGRDGELTEITRLLAGARLVTLTGMRGIGKTCIARAAAARVRRHFAHGAWFVEICGQTDPELLPHVVLRPLRAQDQSARPAEEALADYLADKRMLIVLDLLDATGELTGACATLVGNLLRAAPYLHVLVTAPAPLGVPGEQVRPVPPLDLPAPGADPRRAAAMRLLLARARAAAGVPDPDEAGGGAEGTYGAPDGRWDPGDLAELCRMLGGIPLAIELAAARLAGLSAKVAVDGLGGWIARHEDSPGVITPEGRLRAVIDWTHELCEPAERRLWAELSVFSGCFDAQAAEYVHRGGGARADAPAPLDGLVRAGLVVRERHIDADEPRFRIPAAVAAHGRERLREHGEESIVRERHRDFYLRRARDGEVAWAGRAQFEWYRRLVHDLPNLRVALRYCLRRPAEHEQGLLMACSLWYLWLAAGLAREGRHYLERFLKVATAPSATRTKALWVCAAVAATQGDLEQARRHAHACVSRAEHERDLAAAGYGRHVLGTVAMLEHDDQTAINRLTEAIGWHRATGELTPGLLVGLPQLAVVYDRTGERQQARDLLNEAITVCNEAGELWARSIAVHVLGVVDYGAGDLDAAWAHARDALRTKRVFGDVTGIAMCLELLAWVSAKRGDAVRAARLLGAAQENWSLYGLAHAGHVGDMPQHHECERITRQALGEAAYADAFEEGRGLDLSDAIAYALGEAVPGMPGRKGRHRTPRPAGPAPA